ncbi:hypothetical protein [Mycolicibacterium alvei]|uniref:hypothetical protein n=1 Tax=Mycolicibacterium alvei TaxID=67081 RepID=UPI001F391512|nr:hypothetical protein [Mycolicibacterium alvei]
MKLKTRRADLDAVIDEAAADDSVDCDTAEPVADDITDADTDQDDVLPTADDDSDAAGGTGGNSAAAESEASSAQRGINWTRVLAYGVLPGLILVLGLAAGMLKWRDSTVRASEAAAVESVQVAKDSTVALLSYKPDNVEADLTAARDLLTGNFRDSYAQLTDDVVIPGSKQKQITAVATIPGAASVSATPNRAVVIVFVNQTTTVGQDRPTDSASSVRVTLDKVGDRWLMSGFDPV